MVLTGIEKNEEKPAGRLRRLMPDKDASSGADSDGAPWFDKVPGGRWLAGFVVKEDLAGGDQTVRFQKPAKMAKRVQTLRLLLIAAALFAVVSAVTSIPVAADIADQATETRESLDIPWYNALDAYEDAQASGTEEEIVEAAEWVVFVTEWRDGAIVFDNLTHLWMYLMAAVVILIPVRYLLLLRSLGTGNPRLWSAIRGIAILQIIIEAVKLFVLFWATRDTIYVEMNLAFAPVFVIAPALLYLLAQPDVMAFFSHHRYAPGESLPAPGSADGSAA